MDQRAYLLALVSRDLDEALVISTVTLREGRRTGQPTRETRCIESPCQHGEDTVDFGLLPSKIRGERKWPRTRSKPACLASLKSADPLAGKPLSSSHFGKGDENSIVDLRQYLDESCQCRTQSQMLLAVIDWDFVGLSARCPAGLADGLLSWSQLKTIKYSCSTIVSQLSSMRG